MVKKKQLSFSAEGKRKKIDWNHSWLSISRQCNLLSLSKGAVYYRAAPMDPYNLELMDKIDGQYLETPFYGSRKITVYLRNTGYQVNRKRIQQLMQLMGLEAIYPKPNLSKRRHDHKIYPYLLKGLAIERPNQVWSTDLTYIRLYRSGFMYLTAVIGWYSRYALSWRKAIPWSLVFAWRLLRKLWTASVLQRYLIRIKGVNLHQRPSLIPFCKGTLRSAWTPRGGL